MSQVFNFGDLNSWTPYDGEGPAALLPFDGYVRCQVKSFKEQMSKGDTPKPLIKLTLKIDEEDLPAHTLYAQAMTGGLDKNNENLGRQFAEVIVSADLFNKDTFAAAAAKGESKTVAELMNAIISQNRHVYVQVQADSYQGKTTSRVNNFVTKAVYEREVSGGTHRIPREAPATNGANTAAAKTMLSGVI